MNNINYNISNINNNNNTNIYYYSLTYNRYVGIIYEYIIRYM